MRNRKYLAALVALCLLVGLCPAAVTEDQDIDITSEAVELTVPEEEVALEGEPEGGARCSACFRHSLAAAAAFAEQQGLAGFATSLTVSPHKRSEQVFEAGHAVEGATCPFEEWNFKKRGGFQRSVTLASEYGLYRQRYCGCEFSRRPVV